MISENLCRRDAFLKSIVLTLIFKRGLLKALDRRFRGFLHFLPDLGHCWAGWVWAPTLACSERASNEKKNYWYVVEHLVKLWKKTSGNFQLKKELTLEIVQCVLKNSKLCHLFSTCKKMESLGLHIIRLLLFWDESKFHCKRFPFPHL